MAKRAGLPWDCVLSAELFHHYKPDREAYVTRPLEYGPNQRPHRITDGEFDFTATDFLDLADQLGV